MSNSLSDVERAVVQEDARANRVLTDAEWAEVLPPFCYIKIEYPEWTSVEYDIALKYALRNSSGWVYYSGHRYVFEKADDYMTFKMWVSEKPMCGSDVELT